jgi:hypothetical protein
MSAKFRNVIILTNILKLWFNVLDLLREIVLITISPIVRPYVQD